MQDLLERNLERLRLRISDATHRVRRDPQSLVLVAVTKSVSPALAAELFGLGVTEFGESRADELQHKTDHFRAAGLGAHWHFVGHVQTNKVARIVDRAHVIHSVDSLRLLEAIDHAAERAGRAIDVFLQVKIAPGALRSGATPAELSDLVACAERCAHVHVVGLMTIAPAPDPRDPDAGRSVFERTAALARALQDDPATARAFVDGRVRTSMGMSQDFEQAIAAGSDVVRIGSLLFEGLPRAPAREAESAG